MNSADLQQRSGDCPDLEDLAALLDDRVEEGERQRLLRHLAECQDCYEIYAETARFQLDEQDEQEGGLPPENLDPEMEPVSRSVEMSMALPARVSRRMEEEEQLPPKEAVGEARVTQFPRRVPLWAGLAAAAALVIAAGIPVYRSLTVPPALETADLLPASVGERSNVWTDPTMRGPAGGSTVDAERRERAFQLGVQVTNLRAALLAGDREQAAWAAQQLRRLAGQADFVGDLVETYEGLQTGIREGSLPDLLDRAQEAEARLRDTLFDNAFYFDFGKWAEAGYLSSQARDPRLFADRKVRRFARALSWQDDRAVAAEAQAEVESIRELLGRSSLGDSDYQALQESFERILDTYYPTGRPAAPSTR